MRTVGIFATLLVLAGVVVGTAPGARRKSACPTLCRREIASCVGTCRDDVAACRRTTCQPLARGHARACVRGCRRPCRRECRATILDACRQQPEPTTCAAPVTTTTTPVVPTTTSTAPPGAKVDWPTYGFDAQRTARNPNETALGAANVGGLMQVWATDVGAVVAASPVLASDVVVGGGTVDLLYVGTEHGELYALDAADGHVVWHRNLGSQQTTCDDMPDEVFGISDTPVVDRASGSLFVAGGAGELTALDLATGDVRAGWPVTITTDPAHEHVYSAVTLADGALYVETGSYCDATPYRGRVVKVDPSAAAIVGTWYVTAPPGDGPGGGGIWGWGGASVDPASGDLYVATGNATTTPESYGAAEQVVRLSTALVPEAANYPGLTGDDVDFGSTPVPYQAAGCPGQVVVENKSGVVFVYGRDAIASGPVQQIAIGDYVDGGELIGVPAYDAPTGTIYVSNPTDLTGGPYRHGLLAFTIGADCRLHSAWQQTQGVNGAVVSSPSIANGVVYYGDGPGNEVLALSATSGDVLWRSDATITGGVYAPPIVVNGRLYVAAWDHMVHAYAVGAALAAKPGSARPGSAKPGS